MAPREREWIEVKTDPFWDEFRLFLCSLRRGRFERRTGEANRWANRCDQWETHATLFACIKCGLLPDGEVPTASGQDATPKQADASAKKWEEPLWKEKRIQFLFEHLNILDTKLGMLLNFNSLLLIAVNVLYGGLYNLVPKPFPTNSHIFNLSGHLLIWALAILSVLFGGIWLLITILCLVGERRLVWGDLGLIRRGQLRPAIKEFKDANLLAEAEEEHVRALVIAVVKRTNKFRLAGVLSIINVALLVLTFTIGLGFLYAVNVDFFLR